MTVVSWFQLAQLARQRSAELTAASARGQNADISRNAGINRKTDISRNAGVSRAGRRAIRTSAGWTLVAIGLRIAESRSR